MKFPPVELNPPEPERIVLENGIVVYLLEDHELPLVTVSATIRTGGWMDPSDKVGLAALTGLTMRTGGTQRTPAADLDQELERLAMVMSVSIGVDPVSRCSTCLRKTWTVAGSFCGGPQDGPPLIRLESNWRSCRRVSPFAGATTSRNPSPHANSPNCSMALLIPSHAKRPWNPLLVSRARTSSASMPRRFIPMAYCSALRVISTRQRS
jgi:Predicted Zn-dependent peptidases